MNRTEYIPIWNERPLPEDDYVLLRLLGITYYELVFTDYKLVWDRISQNNLTAKDVQRIKHIRKREKNKLFARGQFHTLEIDIQNLLRQREELFVMRQIIEQEVEYWRKLCHETTTFQSTISD